MLKTLPDTPERAQQELVLQTTLGPALMATKGHAAPEVEQAYARARELCQQVGETHSSSRCCGACGIFIWPGGVQTARELGEQLLTLAQHVADPALLLEAHHGPGEHLVLSGRDGRCPSAPGAGERPLRPPAAPRPCASSMGMDPGMVCLSYAALALWSLGYPDQALQRARRR